MRLPADGIGDLINGGAILSSQEIDQLRLLSAPPDTRQRRLGLGLGLPAWRRLATPGLTLLRLCLRRRSLRLGPVVRNDTDRFETGFRDDQREPAVLSVQCEPVSELPLDARFMLPIDAIRPVQPNDSV